MAISRTLRLMLGKETDETSNWGRWAWIPDRTKAVLAHLRFGGRVLPDPFYHKLYREYPLMPAYYMINAVTPRSERTFWLLVLRGLWMIALLKLRLIR